MNQPMLAAHETQGLAKIVEEANKTFLRDSHSLDRSSFNILRVLSTFRLLYPQSPSNLYNAIIYITKNYDPQTYFQWKKAISQLSRSKNSLARVRSNYCRPDVSIYTKTYQNSFNRERLNESVQHLKSKSYAQINIPQQISYSKEPSIDHDQFQKDASQTNAQTGKRQFYTKADSISHVSKNHYISFQPYRNSTSEYRSHFDKENINSTNIQESRRRQSAYQYIQAMQRDLNRTSKPSQIKTPIDQSFIKNMHNESPYLYTKTLQEISDPIQQQMKARSLTFYHYNLKLKGFSSLQANCFVFLKAKQEEMKAKIRHRSTLLSKSFLGLNLNMKFQRNRKNQIRKAEDFYELSTMKKVFEVLKLIFILKRESDSNRVGKQFANPINLEFITTLLFTAGNQTGQDIIDFNKKVNELLWSEQSGKLHSISKYFGKNSWMKIQNIQDLIRAYKKSLSNKVFSILRNQLNKNKRYDAVRQLNLKRFALFALKIKHSRAACYKQKIQTMRTKMDRSTMQKIMKSLIEIVYSNKLYSKKCEYIARKHSNNLKSTSLQIWSEKATQSLIEKTKMKKNIESLYSVVSTLIGRLFLRKIIEKTKEIDMLTFKIQEQNTRMRKIVVLRNLKRNITSLKQKKEISRLKKNMKLALALKKWKQNTQKGKILNRINNTIKKYVFKTILLPRFQELAEEMREKKMIERNILKKIFALLQKITNDNKQVQEEQIRCLNHKLSFFQKQKSIQSLKQHFHNQRMRKINEINQKKTRLLQIFLLKSQSKKLFDNCSNNKATRKDDQNAFNKLQQRIKYHKMTKIYRQLKEHHDIKRNMNKLRENVYYSRAGSIYSQIVSLIIERKVNKVVGIRKRNFSHSISNILVQSYRKESDKKNKAASHNSIILKYKCFEGLKQILQKSKIVEKIAEKMIKRQNNINAKEKILLAIKETKIRKIAERRETKIFFQNLQRINRFKESQQKLYQANYHNMASSFLMNLQLHEEILEQKKKFQSSSILLRKFIGINRLSRYYTAILINRKHEYMALKFRALKLILCAFRGLQVKRVKKGGHKQLAERLSTDLVG